MKNLSRFFVMLTPLLLVGAFFVSQNVYADTTSQIITLSPGWNVISTPKVLLNHEFSVAETSDNFDIYLLDPTSTSGWQTMQGEGQTEFQPLFAYFINNKTGQNQTLTFNYNFDLTPAQRLFQRTLQPGWNAIGIAQPGYAIPQGSGLVDTNNPNSILSSINGSIGQVVDFTNGNADLDSPAISGTWLSKTAADVSSLNDFRETKAYGVFITSATDNYIGSENLETTPVEPPTINITVDSAFAAQTTIVAGATNATIAKFNIQGYGEDVKVSSLTVIPSLIGTTTPTSNGLQNITLYFNGSQIGTQKNWPGTGDLTFSLGSQMIIPAGQGSTLEVKADLQDSNNNPYTSGTVGATLSAGNNNAQGQTSSTLINFPSSDISTAGLEIESAIMSVSKNQDFADQTVSPNTAGAKIGSFVIQNESTSEAIRLTTLNVKLYDGSGTLMTSGSTPSVTNFSALRTSNTTGAGSTPIQPSGNDTFSINDTLQPGATTTIDIFANTGSTTSTSFFTALTVTGIGTVSNIVVYGNGSPAADGGAAIGQTITLNTGSIATPTLVVAATTPSQYMPGGIESASQISYNFISTGGASTIAELKFTVVGDNTVTKICINSTCAVPVQGIVNLMGLNLAVPNGGSGLNLNALVSYASVGSEGLTPGTTSAVALSYYKYVSGGSAIVKQAPADFTAVVAPTVTLVGSVPAVTISSSGGSTLQLGAEDQIGQATFSASATGAIKLNTITFNVGISGFASPSISSPFVAVSGTPVAGSSCSVNGASTISCTLGNEYASDYTVEAGQSITFQLFAYIEGDEIQGQTAVISTSLNKSGFIWDDTSTNGVSGTGFDGQLIYSFPTNSYTNHN